MYRCLCTYIPLDGRGTGERQMGSDESDAKHSAQHIMYMGRIYFLAQFIECFECDSYLSCVCVCERERVSTLVSDSFVTPWTVAHQAPLCMGFSRQKYWSGLPVPFPEDLPTWYRTQVSHIAGRFFTVRDNREVICCHVPNGPVALQPTAALILSGNSLSPGSTWF